MHLIKVSLLLPLTLISYSASSYAQLEDSAPQPLVQIEEIAPHTNFMLELVGKAREITCDVPYTQTERKHLASTDPMVITGAALKQWIDPIEFPAFLDVINTTMDCDSEQWVKNMNHQISNSSAFKTNLDKIQKKHAQLN